jgi:dsRNA-specific ribonuclease
MLKDDDIMVIEGVHIFNPYNSKNKLITIDKVNDILKKYGIHESISSMELYTRAFTHSSYCKRPLDSSILSKDIPDFPIRDVSNERLEFLGDGILECVTKYYLYRRFPRENEGFMTEKKISLVKNEAIGKLSNEIGFSEWYVLSKHAEEKNTRTNLKKLGCLFEAFVGALFLDFKEKGYDIASTFIIHVLEQHIDWTELLLCDDNYKNILQVKLQKEFKVTPEYIEINHGNEYHMGVYLCIGQPIWKVPLKDAIPFSSFGSFEQIHAHVRKHKHVLVHLGEGKHKIKKKSEQLACENALGLF